jgi:PAS domain S-box-containing protein
MQTGKIFANQALNLLLGEELDKVSDLGWCFQSIHPEDREQVENRVKKVLDKKEQSWEQEFRFRYRDGSYKMMLKRGFIIYENGVAARMICTLQDISEIRELELQLVEQRLRQQKGIAEAIIRAQEMERSRIGNELHDNVNQIISTAQLYLNSLDPEREDFHDLKERTKAILSLSIEEIRKLSREMVAPNLRETGLLKSIQAIVADIRYINPFQIKFEHSETASIEALSHQMKVTLLRIIQEQVKNIVKYSNAETVEISLHCYQNQVRLHIGDDGIGFDAKNTPRGLGLSNIYERTRLYGGKAILHTSPGMGCSLIVNIPLDSTGFLDSREK